MHGAAWRRLDAPAGDRRGRRCDQVDDGGRSGARFAFVTQSGGRRRFAVLGAHVGAADFLPGDVLPVFVSKVVHE